MNIKFIEKLAYDFRKALEVVIDEGRYGRLTLFRNFPNGCCRYASDLLAEYLISNGISMSRIQMVDSESNEEEYTHCWLTIDNNYIIDITADQFNGKSYFKEYETIPSCYVAPCDVVYLHSLFDNSRKNFYDNIGVDSYDDDVSEKLQVVYNEVIRQINFQRR